MEVTVALGLIFACTGLGMLAVRAIDDCAIVRLKKENHQLHKELVMREVNDRAEKEALRSEQAEQKRVFEIQLADVMREAKKQQLRADIYKKGCSGQWTK